MKSILFTLIVGAFLLVGISPLSAQVWEPGGDWERTDTIKRGPAIPSKWVFGGNLAAQFGSFTQVGAAPIVGYRISDSFEVGVSGTYMYSKAKYFDYYQGVNVRQKGQLYGGSVFAKYFAFKIFFVQAELEKMFMDYTDESFYHGETEDDAVPSKYKVDDPALLLGGGLIQSIGGNSYFYTSVSWDVLKSAIRNPYGGNRPIFRSGLMIGIVDKNRKR